ncbi:signal peptidase I [Eubacterium xylanophilum]|uniref:signal peptidase I n=1 Tax=Eubacterium xylanophilum TaxID=39497 RepID=UPI0004ADC384|nr:signal peptidase I [Eubacterium xylanophilum]
MNDNVNNTTEQDEEVTSNPFAAVESGEAENENQEKKRSAKSIIGEILLYAVLIFCCIYVIPNYVVQRTVVNGQSMENTLHNRESLFIDKISYRFVKPSRYEIITFEPPEDYKKSEDELYVKRIYGLPGETIQIKDNDILINGQKVEDKYAKKGMDEAGIAEEPIKLKDDEVFVLGDNRGVSQDSRIIGPIKLNRIQGRAVLRIWPISKFGTIDK